MDIQKVKRSYQPNVVEGKIRALGKDVLVTEMNFEARVNAAGIILPGEDGKNSGIRPRWGKIYSVGPDQDDPELTPGRWILVSHGRWTRGIDIAVDGETLSLRKVDINEILAVADSPVVDDTMSDKVI